MCGTGKYLFGCDTLKAAGSYDRTIARVNGCDSTVTLNVTITTPYVDTLEVRSFYGDRIIMINRYQINSLPGWELDSIDNRY